MKSIIKWFLNGILFLAPIGITLYVVSYLFSFIDEFGKRFIEHYHFDPFPGAGLILTLGIIIFIGFLSQLWLSRKLLEWTELIISRFPGLKTIYSMVKETIQSFIGEKRSFSKVVLITDRDGAKRVGFLTTEDVTHFGLGSEYIAVYIPHGFQVSGELKLYPREAVEFIDMSVEEGMRFCLTAGVASRKDGGTR